MIKSIIALASVATLVQSQAALPACAASAFAGSFSAAPNCSQTDFTCLCNSSAFISAVQTAINTQCVSILLPK